MPKEMDRVHTSFATDVATNDVLRVAGKMDTIGSQEIDIPRGINRLR
jgi:hypothetical protein